MFIVDARPPLLGGCADCWDPTEAAKVMVPLTGVMAGFMFSAIVVIVTVNLPGDKGKTEAALALRLQVVALMTALVAAVANISIAGEPVHLLARTEWELSSGLFWTAVSLMSTSLIWLLIAYGWHSPPVLRLLRGGAYFVLFTRLAGALLASNGYVAEELPGSHTGFHLSAWLCTAITVALTLLFAARPRTLADWDKRIALCCKLTIACLVICFVAIDLIAGSDTGLWTSPPAPLVYLFGALTLGSALVVLPTISRTIPSPHATDVPQPTKHPDGRGGSTSQRRLLQPHPLPTPPADRPNAPAPTSEDIGMGV